MSCCHSSSSSTTPPHPGEGSCCSPDERRTLPADIWLRLGISVVVAGQNMVWGLAYNLSRPEWGSSAHLIGHGWMILSTLLVAALLGPPLAVNAWNRVRLRRLSVEGLFLLTAGGAFVASLLSSFTNTGSVYYEVVSVVMVIYTAGAFVGDRARTRTREAVKCFEEQYEMAVRLESDGTETRVEVGKLHPGDSILVQPGSPVPVDGMVVQGEAFLEEAALTGEPHPRAVQKGDRVRAGSWSQDGRLLIAAGQDPGNRELDQLLNILESAKESPSRLQRHADHIIQWFLPFVAAVSLSTFIGWAFFVPWSEALFNSMAVLLVACPCALGLATPIAVWSGLWRLFHLGIVSRSASLIDALAETKRIFFDKTGTLSEMQLQVAAYHREDNGLWSDREIKGLLLALESGQKHPMARALAEWAQCQDWKGGFSGDVCALRMVPGRGLEAEIGQELNPEKRRVRLGTASWIRPELAKRYPGHWVFLECEGHIVARFELREKFREDLATVFLELEALGIRCEILTGDPHADEALLPGVKMTTGCSPEQKRKIVQMSREAGEFPLFIGDGVNDTAAMQVAAASLAIDEGSDLAQSISSGILRGGSLCGIPEAIAIGRAIQKTLRQNLVFAALYNFAGMGLAVAGILHPVVAALLMVLSSAMVSWRAASSAEKAVRKRQSHNQRPKGETESQLTAEFPEDEVELALIRCPSPKSKLSEFTNSID